eukprot:SM000049S16795  [mRNA]  locus=s49:779814:780107:- [translate_table: standard]
MADHRRATAVLVALALAVDNADEVLLPVVYREVGASLRISLHGLTLLTLARSLAHSLSCPIATALTNIPIAAPSSPLVPPPGAPLRLPAASPPPSLR